MKDYDDELKDLFQNKNLENAFSPDEQNWTKMATVLKNEQKVKRKFLLYFSVLLLLTGIVGTVYFIGSENGTSALAVRSQKGIEKTEVGNQSKELPEPAAMEKKGPSVSPQHTKVDQKQKVTEHTKISDPSAPLPEAKQTLLNKAPEGDTAYEGNEKAENKHPAQKKQLASAGDGTEKTSALHISSGEDVLKEATQTKSVDLNKSTPLETAEIVDGEQTLQTTLKSQSKAHDQAQTMGEIEQTKIAPHMETIKQESGLAENKVQTPLIADVLAMTDVVLPAQRQDSLLKGATVIIENPSVKTVLSRRIFMEIGTNYLLGWKTDGKREAAGFNPLIGLQYSHELNKKVALSLGIQYSSINHLSSTSHTSTTTRLKFGEEMDATVVSALSMHYLYAPVKINYRFNRNNSFAFGYTLAYLLDAESRVETYTTRLDYVSTPVVSKSMGYTKGFNPYDGQIALSYRRRFYNQWYVNAEVYYGLLDIKNNAVYKSNAFERTSGFKLSLGINLWKNN